MKRLLPATKSAAKKPEVNSRLTDFLKVTQTKKDFSSSDSTQKSTPEEKKLETSKANTESVVSAGGNNKRTTKANSKKGSEGLYSLPKLFNHTHEHIDGSFKDGKANIWLWNINGVNAILTKGLMQEFLDKTNPDIICFNETKIDSERLDQ
jgi:hypothetical protein